MAPEARSLRDLWPSLSPRERDAKVAEALGWKLVQSGNSELRYPIGPANTVPAGDREIPWAGVDLSTFFAPFISPYSTSWEHAGPLLDQLAADGWTIVLRSSPTHGYDVMEATLEGRRFGCRSEGGPSTIALAFCLARESSCTKRWEGGPCRWEPGAPGDPDWCYYCERLRPEEEGERG